MGLSLTMTLTQENKTIVDVRFLCLIWAGRQSQVSVVGRSGKKTDAMVVTIVELLARGTWCAKPAASSSAAFAADLEEISIAAGTCPTGAGMREHEHSLLGGGISRLHRNSVEVEVEVEVDFVEAMCGLQISPAIEFETGVPPGPRKRDLGRMRRCPRVLVVLV
jgi:hypothetical protein